MTKKKKIALISTLVPIPVVAIATTVIAATISSNKNDSKYNSNSSNILDNNKDNPNNGSSNSGYIYNGEYYSDFNDIVKKYVDDNKPIGSDYYMGDFRSAFNYSDKTLKMDFLRKYDEDRILPAYKTASGAITEDFDKAKKSFLNSSRTRIFYTDFNGRVYNDKTDAKNAIAEQKESTPIMYYTLSDGTRINPLNSVDLNSLKTKAYKEIYNFLNGSSNTTNSEFSISLYDQATDNSTSKNKLLSSKYSNAFFNKGNAIENIIKDILTTIYNAQLEYISNNLTFDVKVEVRNIVRNGSKISYGPTNKTTWGINEYRYDENSKYPKPIDKVTSRKSSNDMSIYLGGEAGKIKGNIMAEAIDKYPLNQTDAASYYTSHSNLGMAHSKAIRKFDFGRFYNWSTNSSDSITFPNVKLNELNQFDTFLSYDKLINSKYCNIEKYKYSHGYYVYDLANYIRINNFRGTSFNLRLFCPEGYYDAGWSNANGIDFEPFKFGVHSKCSSDNFDLTAVFDVWLKKSSSSNVSTTGMFEFIKNKLNEKYMVENGKYSDNFLLNKILSFIGNLFKNNSNSFYNKISSLLDDNDFSILYTNGNNEFKLNQLSEKPNFTLDTNFQIINANNSLWFDKSQSNNFLSFGQTSSNGSTLDGVNINYDNILKHVENGSSLNDILEKNYLKLVIEFNNNPLFMVDLNISLLDHKKYPNLTFKQIIQKNFFKNVEPSENDLNKLTNISQNFECKNYPSLSILRPNNTVSYFNVINLSANDKISKITVNDKETNEEKENWKFEYINNDPFSEGLMPELKDYYSDTNNSIDKLKINMIVNVFNELKSMKHSYITNLVEPNDIVFLFDKFDSKRLNGLNLKFRRFLGQGLGDNPSLSNGEQIQLYDNLLDLDYALKNKLQIEPGTIVFLYDDDGNVVNPGVQITEQEEIWLTSDSVYGSEAIMKDNFLRTKIIRPLEDKVFYKENGDTKTLISNEINKVFTFTIPDKNSSTGGTITNYFLSYEDCYNKLVSYIRTLCTPVTIKK